MNFTIGLVFMILELLDISIGNTVNNQWFTQIGAEPKLSLSLIRLTHALIWEMFGTNLGINGMLLTLDVVQWNMLYVKLIILVWKWNKEIILAKLEALWKLTSTVWKFQHFSSTQILREIHFWDPGSAKNAIYCKFEAFEFLLFG